MSKFSKFRKVLKNDDPFDTYIELYLVWIGACLGVIAIGIIIGIIQATVGK